MSRRGTREERKGDKYNYYSRSSRRARVSIVSSCIALSLSPPPPLQLPPHRLDLLQHLLLGQQALAHEHAPRGLLLVHDGLGEFFDRGYLAPLEFFCHAAVPSFISFPYYHHGLVQPDTRIRYLIPSGAIRPLNPGSSTKGDLFSIGLMSSGAIPG